MKNFKKILKVLKFFIKFLKINKNLYFLLLSRLTAGWSLVSLLIFLVLGERSPCFPWLRPCSALSYFYLGGLKPSNPWWRASTAYYFTFWKLKLQKNISCHQWDLKAFATIRPVIEFKSNRGIYITTNIYKYMFLFCNY